MSEPNEPIEEEDDGDEYAPMGDALEEWHKAVETLSMVDPETMRELCRRAQAGDIAARNRAVEANVRLVERIAKRYQGRGLDLIDLIQHGCIGLMVAIERYDPDKRNPQNGKPYAFSTYATPWIRQKIQRALFTEGEAIRKPDYVMIDVIRMRRGGKAKPENAANVQAAEAASGIYSLDAPLFELETDEPTFADLIAAETPSTEDIAIQRETMSEFARLFDLLLSKREQYVIMLRFGFLGEPLTLEETAKRLGGISRQRASQIEARAISRLQEKLALDPDGGGVVLKSVLRRMAKQRAAAA